MPPAGRRGGERAWMDHQHGTCPSITGHNQRESWTAGGPPECGLTTAGCNLAEISPRPAPLASPEAARDLVDPDAQEDRAAVRAVAAKIDRVERGEQRGDLGRRERVAGPHDRVTRERR